MPDESLHLKLLKAPLSVVIEAIEHFPVNPEVTHCGTSFRVSPFAHYGTCPLCGVQIKLRSFSAVAELEDIFEAVFKWMNRPGANDFAQQRIQEMAMED